MSSTLFAEVVERLTRGSVASHSAVSLLVVSSLRGVVASAAATSSVASVSASLSAAGYALINADRTQLFIPALIARAQRLLVEEASRAFATPAAATPRAALEAELNSDPAGCATDCEWLPAATAATPFSDATRRGLLDGLDELADEIENANAGLEPFVSQVLRDGDAVLTAGYCPNVVSFLRHVAAAFPLDVIVADGGPRAPGRATAAALSVTKRGVAAIVTMTPDTGVWALLSAGGARRVILPASAIARDGSVVAPAGALAIALAAQHFSIPVVIVATSAKFSPAETAASIYARGGGDAALQGPPSDVLAYADAVELAAAGARAASHASEGVRVLHTVFDVLPAALSSLIVTSAGVVTPGSTWRLVDEIFGRPAPPL